MTGLPALLAALGAVALGFGLLSAMLALFAPASDLGWIVANLMIGAILLGVSVAMSIDTLRERMQSGEARRAGRYGSSAIFGTALGIAFLCLLGFLSTRHSVRYDWSEAGINTLSDQTLELLGRLEEEVAITAFFNAADAPPVRDLLDRYAFESGRVRLQFVDPNRRPDLIEAYAIDPEALAGGLVRIAIGDDATELDNLSESEITNALLKLLKNESRKIYFVEGHNERALEDERGDAAAGFSTAMAALRNETYDVGSILLASVGDVPADANLVILAGPTRPLLVGEHNVLASYLDRGGALMVLLDPRANTDLVDDLAGWGILVGEDVVFDAKLAVFGQATTPFSSRYEAHPITEKLRDTVIFHMARSVRVDPDHESDMSAIVFTGEDSWAETDLEKWTESGRAEFGEGDLLGPVPIVVAGELTTSAAAEPDQSEQDAEPHPGRLVVVGDSDFASNAYIGNYQNRDLFVNAVNWLVDDSDQIAVRPPISRASRFQMTGQQYLRIQYLSLFVVPEALAIAGVLTWWMRRKRSGS